MAHSCGRARPGFLLVVAVATLGLLAGGLSPAGAGPALVAERSSAPVAEEVRVELAASGRTSFWVRFDRRSDLDAAAAEPDWATRGEAVVAQLERTAERSQDAVRDLLEARDVDFEPFWVINAIHVTAGADIVDLVAGQPGVSEILADPTVRRSEAAPAGGAVATERAEVAAVEWNLARVRAPEVWSTFGTRGEGIVIGSIDDGVEFDHPALVDSYRGNNGDGSFDHAYNWYDPQNACGDPSLAPCSDIRGTGTHDVGTMVGDDGAGNQIGGAPGARWISARGCSFEYCDLDAVVAAAQWMLAPTDLAGENPRPDLRPNVVNSSWPAAGPLVGDLDEVYEAAGVVAVNSPPPASPGNCGSAYFPFDQPSAITVGAFDANEAIAEFSGRGPTWMGETEPDLTAPGVDIRSSVTGGGYEVRSGSSAAGPHVTATVALMWSAAPALMGDTATTRALLDQTAQDRSDLSCGGEDGNNNVWGEGTLDAYRAVEASPRTPAGVLAGTVTDTSGAPLAGAEVHVTGLVDRTTRTALDGAYDLRLPVGTYDVEVGAFGHEPSNATAIVTAGATTTLDAALTPLPAFRVSGTVLDQDGEPVFGATVTVAGTPLAPVTSAADGTFTIAGVPEGEHTVQAADPCLSAQMRTVVVDADVTVDFGLERRHDAAGYSCATVPPDYVEADTVIDISNGAGLVDLPFPFWFYDRSYSTVWVNRWGLLTFGPPAFVLPPPPIPAPDPPNAIIAAFLDSLSDDEGATVHIETVGEAPNRAFVVEWRDFAIAQLGLRVSFEIKLYENGHVEMQYRDIDDDPAGRERGRLASIGLENDTGTDGFQYAYQEPVLRSDLGVHYRMPIQGLVHGRVTDANDGAPLDGATVTAARDGSVVAIVTTAANGSYQLRLPAGTYTIEAAYRGEGITATTVVIDESDEPAATDFELPLARVTASTGPLEFVLPPDRTGTQDIVVANVGVGAMEFELQERPAATAGSADATGAAPDPVVATSTTATDDAAPALAPEPVLFVVDAVPLGDAVTELLDTTGVPYDVVDSTQLATIDLERYRSVIVSDSQPDVFYDNYSAALPRLTGYVEQGGLLWVGAAGSWFSDPLMALPGGVTSVFSVQNENDVVDPDHPTMQGLPSRFGGWDPNYLVFDHLTDGAHVIARGAIDPRATVVEYPLGAGKVLATSQNLEVSWEQGAVEAPLLANAVTYVSHYEASADVPWLAAEPAAGELAPGASTSVTVTVDTTGLAPGVHRSHLLVRSNDPFTPTVRIPVKVLVPLYQVAVDAGASRPFTDVAGDTWVADQRHTAGGWGYTNGSASALNTARPIARTVDDPLFQTIRANPRQYRFDGVPNGIYQVDLRFAETNGRRPGRRQARLIVEQTVVYAAHDISAEVGTFAADEHTVFVEVTDGQLNVRFVELSGVGVPIVSGLRVTHRADR